MDINFMGGSFRQIPNGCGWINGIAGLVFILSFLCGCEDNRVDQAEFLAMQEKICTVPTTQPVVAQVSDVVVNQSLSEYKIGPGDVLAVTINGTAQVEAAPPQQVRVNRKGEIQLPIVGKIAVSGLELEDAEAAIQQAYIPKVYRQATVHIEIAKPLTTNVLVTGAVTQPGLVPLFYNQRNLLYAIVGAGGINERASRQVILRRIRSPKEAIKVDLSNAEGMRQALALAPLQTGDIVEVQAAAPNTVFVGGLVRNPYPQVYPPGTQITVLQALAASGGLRTDLTPREATLIRRMQDGKEVQVKLNLDRIAVGKDPNLVLAAGDILWVPYSVETRVQEWINQNLYLRGGASFSYSQTGDHNYLHGKSFNAGQTTGGNLQDTYDPFGFLNQNSSLNQLISRPTVTTP